MKTSLLLLTALLLPAAALAGDPNFLTPNDLPLKAQQIFGSSGRGDMPTFNEGYGIEQALKLNYAGRSCMAPVGRQLTPWAASQRTDGFYWHYTIAAEFECLAPKVRAELNGTAALNLYNGLKTLTEAREGVKLVKAGLVVCYDRYEQVCEGNRLIRYQNRETCELLDKNKKNELSVLDDLIDGQNVIRLEGANALEKTLPVYNDGRRDDTPRGNCVPHEYGQLKGLSRKAAKVACEKGPHGAVSCVVVGIIKD